MRLRTAAIMPAAALATVISVSVAQAGMNNVNMNPVLAPRAPPTVPDVRARSLSIDSQLRLSCYPVRERDERGVWVPRTRCN